MILGRGKEVPGQISSEVAESEIACLTPLPLATPDEQARLSGPLTQMEQTELNGRFGSAPLEVNNGVAVTEEAVGLHVPDVITQFCYRPLCLPGR